MKNKTKTLLALMLPITTIMVNAGPLSASSQLTPAMTFNTTNQMTTVENRIGLPLKEVFPDPIFAQFIADTYGDGNIEGLFTQEIIDRAYELYIGQDYTEYEYGAPITSVEGMQYLTRLSKIDLFTPQVKSLPEDIGNLVDLYHLRIDMPLIEKLPDSFFSIDNIETLLVYNSDIKYLPEEISNFKKLDFLKMNSKSLEQFPESFGELENLTLFSSTAPKVTQLPESFGNLINLDTMELNEMQLTKLPENFGNLKKLRIVYMSDTQITQLPDNIGDLESLVVFMLTESQLTNLPESFSQLSPHLVSAMFGENLMPEGYETYLHNLNIKSDLDHTQRQLRLISDVTTFDINSPDDFNQINLRDLVKIDDTTLSPNLALSFVDMVDESGNSVTIEDYINNEEVTKSGTVYAKITAAKPGALSMVNNNATTKAIQLNFKLSNLNVRYFIDGVEQTTMMQVIKNGSQISASNDPVMTGFDFDGWYIDESYTTKFDFTSTIHSNLDLHGRFVEQPIKPVDPKEENKNRDTTTDETLNPIKKEETNNKTQPTLPKTGLQMYTKTLGVGSMIIGLIVLIKKRKIIK